MNNINYSLSSHIALHEKKRSLYRYIYGLLAGIMCIIIISSNMSITVSADDYPKAPDIESGNCILMDADSGIVLYEKNSGAKCYPASVTKLMTALIVAENCNLGDTLTVSRNAVSSVKYGDAAAGLKTGEEFTVEQALNVMLIKSANDMAYALGEYAGGSIANFANMMNKKAEELGCLNTHFTNASGLTDLNHYTTAYDMALICRKVLGYPAIMNAISYNKSYSVPPTNKTADTRYYRLSHSMVTGKYLYEYCIGGKTGYTDAAGHTLATFAEKDGIRLICVIFNSTDEQRYIDTTALFEYGFNNFHRLNISQNEDTFSFNQGLGLGGFGISGKALNINSDIQLSVPDSDCVIIPLNASFSDLTKEIIYRQHDDISETINTDNETASTASDDSITASNILADIYYYYGGHEAGHTSLYFSGTKTSKDTPSDNGKPADSSAASDNQDQSDGSAVSGSALPYLASDTSTSPLSNAVTVTGNFIYINLWLFISTVCVMILIVILLVINAKKNRHGLRF